MAQPTSAHNSPPKKAFEARTFLEIAADDEGNLPSDIEIMRPVKITKSPTKPDFEITTNDLDEYVSNFRAGLRKGVPIDIEHGQDATFGQQAAGWIKDLYVQANDAGKSLMAKVEWNTLGKQLVGDKRFRFISPQFVPRSLGAYEDPEGKGSFYNVLKAVTVTNKPLFKGLKALSADEGSTSGLTVLISENTINAKERVEMNLDDVRKKDPSQIDADERKFLEEKKDELSASERIGFGIDKVETKEEPEKKPEVKADEGDGKTVTIDATEWSTMKAQMKALEIKANEGQAAKQQLEASEVKTFVQEHVKRGAVKPGEAEKTEKMILAAEGEARDGLKTFIQNLPDHAAKTGESGLKDKTAADSAAEELENKTKELMASDDGKGLDYASAMKKVIAANEDLANEYKEELAQNQGGSR